MLGQSHFAFACRCWFSLGTSLLTLDIAAMSSDADGGQECHSKPRKQPRITRDRRSGGMRCLGSCGDQYIHSTSATLSPRLLRVTAEMHSSPHCRFNTQHSRMLPCRRFPGWGVPAGAERVMRTGALQAHAAMLVVHGQLQHRPPPQPAFLLLTGCWPPCRLTKWLQHTT